MAESTGTQQARHAKARADRVRLDSEIEGRDDRSDPFVAAVRATRMPMIITDPRLPDNPAVFVNDAFCRMSGYARDEILGRNCRFLQGPQTDPADAARIARALEARQPIQIDIRNHRRNGAAFWNRLLVAPVHDATGALAYFFASQVDVTEERDRLAGLESRNASLLAELTEKLRQQERDAERLRRAVLAEQRAKDALALQAAEFQALAENVRHLAWIADPRGDIFWYNKRWYEYTGATPEQMRAGGWRGIHHPDHVDRVLREVGRRWRQGKSWRDIHLLRSAAGEYRPFLTQAEPIHDRDGRLVRWFGTNTDISPQLDAERELRVMNQTLAERVESEVARRLKTEALLRQSQKMEAVGQLTGGLAHDFNNLLTGIAGNLELLQERVRQGRSDGLDRYVAAARDAAGRAAALTHRLLAFSRRQTLEPKATDVGRLARGLEEMIRRSIGPSVACGFVEGKDIWTTLVDQSQLENALLNLCINARDAMPDGGRLTIETGNTRLDGEAAAARDLSPGEYVTLSVTDDGAGMSPEVAARAFDPFYTTKPIGAGTGLGLSMIYGFARQSGGQVRIHSSPGLGTTVRLYLPRHPGEAETAPAHPSRNDAYGARAGETVLVVDDEPTVRMLVTDTLEQRGYRVLEAGTGAEGLDRLRREASIDLLLTDVGLPGGMNGRQLADAARQDRPALRVLFITGYADAAVLGHERLDRGMHVLTKPFAMHEMNRRVREIIDGGPDGPPAG